MAISLQALQPQNFQPIAVPSPEKRFRTLAEARGTMQQEQFRGQQIQQNEGEMQAQKAALAKAAQVHDILAQSKGALTPEVVDSIFAVDQGMGMSLRKIAADEANVKSDNARSDAQLFETQIKNGADQKARKTSEQLAQDRFNLDLRQQDEVEKNGVFARLKPTPEKAAPAIVSEYEYAKANGFKGSFSDYQNEDANRHRSTTTINNGGSAIGDFNKTGKDFLSTIPAQWRKTVEKIANYEEDPTKVASMRGGMREQLTQWVNQVNQDYDAGLFMNRAPTRKAFTSGTQGQQINAINTAIGHIDQITGLAEKLGNGSFVKGNELWNWARTNFGDAAVTNFDTLKDALAGEVSSVLSKGSATVSGIAEAKEKIKAASSPAQLAGYVKTLIPILGSKLHSLDYQYHQAMGENDSFSALSPESKSILAKYGVTAPAGTSAGGGSVGQKADFEFVPGKGLVPVKR